MKLFFQITTASLTLLASLFIFIGFSKRKILILRFGMMFVCMLATFLLTCFILDYSFGVPLI